MPANSSPPWTWARYLEVQLATAHAEARERIEHLRGYEAELAGKIAKAELAAYEKCRDAIVQLPHYTAESTINNLIADWHKRVYDTPLVNPPKPECGHKSSHTVCCGTNDLLVQCDNCPNIRRLGPWTKPAKGATV